MTSLGIINPKKPLTKYNKHGNNQNFIQFPTPTAYYLLHTRTQKPIFRINDAFCSSSLIPRRRDESFM